ncbi:unnamed protein product [Penicillium olsonii]|nr:unnamed protein product [Penicillium olsonii]CAG7927360.1 unnamed protein product [Penicillium olsonii]
MLNSLRRKAVTADSDNQVHLDFHLYPLEVVSIYSSLWTVVSYSLFTREFAFILKSFFILTRLLDSRRQVTRLPSLHKSSVELKLEAIRANVSWLQGQQDFTMASSYQGLRESLQTALQQTDLMDNQGTTPNVSDLPSFLQELLHRHPPNFGDETPDAGSDDCSTTENDTSTEESSSALSQACGSESDDGSIVSTTSDPNQLSSAVVGAFIEYYVSEKFRKVQDRASSNGEPAEHSNMTEHNDEQTEQLKAEKKVLEDRLSKLKATVHESIVSECGGTVSVAKTQCQSLDETIKCICRINVRLGIVQDQKTDDPMLHLPPNSQEAGFTDNGKRRRTQSPGPTESESRARSFSVNAKSWGEIKEQQDSDCALLKVLLGKGENFLNDLLHFTSGTSRHSLPDELDTALEDMRKGNDAPPENQDVNHFTMVSFAELFIAWLWCIKVPTEGFEARKVSEAIFFKTHAPLIVGRFIRSLKSEVAHCLACVRLLWAERDRTVNAAGTPIILDSTHHGVLRPHQLSGVRFLWREIVQETQPGGALLAHEMGLGKTLQM